MKFGKEFVAQMVPEWQEAYMDYNLLKSQLKEIQKFDKQTILSPNTSSTSGVGLKRRMTMYRAFSGLTRPLSNSANHHHQWDAVEDKVKLDSHGEEGSEREYRNVFLMPSDETGEYERLFFKRLDGELNKVNSFYKNKVEIVLDEAAALNKQMNALIAFRIKVDNSEDSIRALFPFRANGTAGTSMSGKGVTHMNPVQEDEISRKDLTEEQEGSNDGGGVNETITNSRRSQVNKLNVLIPQPASLELLDHVKINFEPKTPVSTLKGMLMDSKSKDPTFSKLELEKAEEQLKQAFIEFDQKLRLLKSYSFLNLLAFSKIMKKYDKITSRNVSRSYLRMVDKSYLGTSDEVTRLMERVEATFIKHFYNSNRSKGIMFLRPKAKRERHRITFFLGFTVGFSIALVVALVLIIRHQKILSKEGASKYMDNMFPLYSIFGFIILHMLMYAGNIYLWRRYRVNYPFIFGFKEGTELGYREVCLVSSSLAILALAAILSNMDMEIDPNTKDYRIFSELIPLLLVICVLLITICPFNIVYRSSRFFLLRCAFRCICAPLYKVTLPDFFLADQLTSQVQAVRSLEFYICYYGWGNFRHREQNCSNSSVYQIFYFIVALIPYWSRFLQCMRRLFEEKDVTQGYNALKYFSTIIAVVMRTAYSLNKGMGLKVLAGITSAISTIIGTYWDIVKDWGLLQRHSKNRWLRDKLLVSHNSVYFAAMVFNVLLRLAWLQSVVDFNVSFLHNNALVSIIACLEIIRRGVWNFLRSVILMFFYLFIHWFPSKSSIYSKLALRLENEHLNNVGKYRAFKSVPLPFNYTEDDDKDE